MICLLSGRYIKKDGRTMSFADFFNNLRMTNKVCLELDTSYVSNQTYTNYVRLLQHMLNRIGKMVYIVTDIKKIKIYKPSNRNIEQYDATLSIDLGISISGLYTANNGKSFSINTADIFRFIDEYKTIILGRSRRKEDCYMYCVYQIILFYLKITKKHYYLVNESFTTKSNRRKHPHVSKKQRDELAAYSIYRRWLHDQIKLI